MSQNKQEEMREEFRKKFRVPMEYKENDWWQTSDDFEETATPSKVEAWVLEKVEKARGEERERIQLAVESLSSMSWSLKDGTIMYPTLAKMDVMEILLGNKE